MKRLAEHALLAAQGVWLTLLWLAYARPFQWPMSGMLAGLVDGSAPRPFVYRALAPLLVRSLIAVPGVGIQPATVLVVALSFIGWLWALRWLADLVLPAELPMLATVAAAGPVGLLFVAGGYVYDPLTLALFTLSLALIASGRHWRLYAVVYMLMCFCRETAILLPLVCLARAGRRGWPAAVYQAEVWALVRLMLAAAVYGGNPGANFETHWAEHLQWLWNYPLPNVLALAVYGGALAVAVWRWQTQPPFMRAAAVVVPAIFAAYWLVGYPGEIRVCLEAYPVLCLLTWHGVYMRGVLPTAAAIARLRERRRQPSSDKARPPAASPEPASVPG